MENKELFKNAKLLSKKIEKLTKKLDEIEATKSLDRSKEIRHDFQIILQLLQIEFKSNDKEEIF